MISSKPSLTVNQAILSFLKSIALARSANTARSYANAMQAFTTSLEKHNLPSDKTKSEDLPEEAAAWFAEDLKNYAPTTERLYLTALHRFYEYLAGEALGNPNLARVSLLIRQRSRRPGQRLPQFPRMQIEEIILHANNLAFCQSKDRSERLRNLRDRAFLLTLADTGLRVHEACALRRGDIDWNEGKAVIIGKGDIEAVVRFSTRSLAAIKDYLAERSQLDGCSRKALSSLPLFARHDKGAGEKVKPITTATGRNIVEDHVQSVFGDEAVGKITPHSFRHYFVTTVLLGSGGNLKLAQELARHKNISVTQRYAHLNNDELDQGYREIFQ